VDEGNYVARVFDDFRNRIRKRNRMSVLGKVRSIGLLKSMIEHTVLMSSFERTEEREFEQTKKETG